MNFSNGWRTVPHLTLLLLAPLVLLPHLLLLAWGEVVLDVERLPDLLWRLPLDHVGHCLAGDVQQALDVQVVGGEDQLEERALINLQWFDRKGECQIKLPSSKKFLRLHFRKSPRLSSCAFCSVPNANATEQG